MTAFRTSWFVLALGLLACVRTEGADVERTTPSPPPSLDVAEPCGPQSMRSCFGEATRIAGTANITDKGVDGWRPEFEGGPAIEAELSRPHFVQADASGDIFVADKDAHAVRLISTTGRITTLASAPDLRAPNGLWVRSDGRAYVLDLGHSAIKRLDKSGALSLLFEVSEGIRLGRGLWVAADESLAYLSSGTKVLRWTPQQGVETFAEGFAGLGNLIVDPEGALVVTDRSAGRVYRLNDAGERTVLAGNGAATGGGHGALAVDSSIPGVRALWFDDAGGLFLGTHESSAVWYVGADGRLQKIARAPDVSEVRGLSLDHAGNLLLVDHDGGRVWRLERLGRP